MRSFIFTQNKFREIPVVLVTAEHLRTGKEYDASLIWTEDTSKDSFQVCLREMQNFDGKHEDINVVCSLFVNYFACKESFNMWVSNLSLKIQNYQHEFCGIEAIRHPKVAAFCLFGEARDSRCESRD